MPFADDKTPHIKMEDLASLPGDAIIIVCDSTTEALRRIPSAVVMSPKKYKALLDEIARLKAQLQTDKPATPSECHLKGKVDNNAVLLQATFVVVTDRDNAAVTLGCPQAWATSAQIEGRTPLIRADTNGFLVRIEKPGKYRLTLDLIVPLAVRTGNERGFELSLPHAAINSIELELPDNAKDVQVGGRPLNDPQLAGLVLSNRRLRGGLGRGTVDKLDLAWKESRPSSGAPVVTAEGSIQVRLEPSEQVTQADLLLKVEGEPRDSWRLFVPLDAEVKVLPPDDRRVQMIETANQAFASLRTIRLKQPSAERFRVQVTARTPLPSKGKLTPVGPFLVVGATRQTGSLLVRNLVRNLHVDYREHGDMKQRRLTDEQTRDPTVVASFTYGNVPWVDKPKGTTGPFSLSWLDLETEMVRTRARTRVAHALSLRPGSPREAPRWDVVSTITPVSKWTDVDRLKVVVPVRWVPADKDLQIGQDKESRFVTFPTALLARDGSSQPLTLAGRYEAPREATGRAILKLPWPEGAVEQCEVTVQVPRDSEVSLHNADSSDLELVKQTGTNEQTWRYRRVPAGEPAIEVDWRPYRPELQVTSVVDLTLGGTRGDLRHELLLQAQRGAFASIALLVPEAVRDSLRVEGGTLQASRDDAVKPPGFRRFFVAGKFTGTECRLVLHYSADLRVKGQAPIAGEPFAVPLVRPEEATRGETKVRVWAEPGYSPLPLGGPLWDEKNVEEVKDHGGLPILVLQSQKLDAPLVLRAGKQAADVTVLVERALVRAQLLEGGGQSYRVSFQLRQLADRFLDVELPGPVATLNLKVALNRRKLTPDIVNAAGQQTDGGNFARLRLGPELIRQTTLLELSYQLQPGRTASSPLRATLQPPKLRGAPETVPTRWQVSLPSNRILLAPESASGLERRWVRLGWLLAYRLKRDEVDFEREFEASLPPELRSSSERVDSESAAVPALVCWQDSAGPILLTHAPRQAWLLVCSLVLLILGLGLFWLARPRSGDGGPMAAWLWPILAFLTVAVGVAVLFWPAALWAVVYGCEPGALVLLGVVAFQWTLHQRSRRQIVYLPSFSRKPPGSSLLRKNSSHRQPHGEPSTIDAPPPNAAGPVS
jgi:hypothetical protein